MREPWKVTLVDTGLHTMTGGRINESGYVGAETLCLPMETACQM